jgi:predicted metalloendopeptidase
VKISTITFFDNYFSFVKYAVEKELSSVGELVDKNEWGMTPQVVAWPPYVLILDVECVLQSSWE